MKREDFDIDLMLNAFIDGELPQRQQTQVQRLIAHDAEVAERLHDLEKCRMLIGSVPVVPAPPDLARGVRAALDESGGEAPVTSAESFGAARRRGARHLMGRRMLAAAAMVGLVALLGAVVYTVLSPRRDSDGSTVAGRPVASLRRYESEPVAAVSEGPAECFVPAESRFIGTVDLRTDDFVAVNAFMGRVISDNAFLRSRNSATGRSSTYQIEGSAQAICLLLNDLESIWDKLGSVDLFVACDKAGAGINIPDVDISQVAEVVKARSDADRTALARDFAAFNGVDELMPGRALAEAVGRRSLPAVTIPRPVLTGNGRQPAKPAGQRREAVVEIVFELSATGR